MVSDALSKRTTVCPYQEIKLCPDCKHLPKGERIWQVRPPPHLRNCWLNSDGWEDILIGGNCDCLSFIPTPQDDGYQYRLIIKSCDECSVVYKTCLSIYYLNITQNPLPVCFSAGGTATFEAKAETNCPNAPTVQWQVSSNQGATWTNIPGATSTSYSFVMVNGQQGNLYRAVFTYCCGDVASTFAELFDPSTLIVNGGLDCC